MRDPYDTLEIARGASLDDIKRAFRRLAKELHPDLNPNDPARTRRFRDLAAAYDILSDEDKRRQLDRELALAEAPRRQADAKTAFEEGLESFFSRAGKSRERGGESSFLRGADIHQSLRIGFVEAALGARKRLELDDHRAVEVVIPAGTADGHVLRLKGQGRPGRLGRPPGDALVEVTVDPHPTLRRRDRDIHQTLPVTVPEAVQGAAVVVPTIHGPVQLRIPRGSNTDTVLRLKGKGVPAPEGGEPGDHYVKLKVVLPPGEDTEFSRIVEQWGKRRSYIVR
jgi:DnaJ-class molecular chaperone